MTYLELEAEARRMTKAGRDEGMKSLAAHPHFPALIRWLLDHEAEAQAQVVNPKASTEPGLLAHAAGALYEVELLLEQVAQLPPKGS